MSDAQIVKHKGPPDVVAAQPQPAGNNLLAVIARAAADPQVDVAKMQALLDMQMRISEKQAEAEFNAAMAALQPKLPRVPKNGQIVNKDRLQSTFARFEDIDTAIRPLLEEHGFSVTYGMEAHTEKVAVSCTVRHRGGHSVTNVLPLPVDTSGAKNNVQGVGSTISYAKRYLLIMAFNIVMEGEDNDGNKSERISQQQADNLRDLISLSKSDLSKFLQYMRVERIEDILVDQYTTAVNLLNQKIKGHK